MLGLVYLEAAQAEPAKRVLLGKVWSGAPARFAGIWRDGFFFLAYYGADRAVVVQKLDAEGNSLERAVLDERFGGWDSHNSLVLELDAQHRVHLAGNMHATPLVYFSGSDPYSAKSLSRVDRMVGRAEERVTYPRLFRHGDTLYFFYRAGGSGNGRWLLNEWNGIKWRRARPGEVFANRDADGRVSAYPSSFVPDGHGGMGVAYVWRRGPDASLNVRMCFARTRDFVTWTAVDGARLDLPLSTECPMPVEDTGPGRGLNNNQELFFSTRGEPIIIYHKLDERSHNQVYMATPRDGAWKAVALTDWTGHFDFAGPGSLPLPFAISSFQDDAHGRIVVAAQHEHLPSSLFYIDRTTLEVTRAPVQPKAQPISTEPQSSGKRMNAVRITDELGHERGMLTWVTLRQNRDRPPACADPSLTACLPAPSELQLSIRGRAEGSN